MRTQCFQAWSALILHLWSPRRTLAGLCVILNAGSLAGQDSLFPARAISVEEVAPDGRLASALDGARTPTQVQVERDSLILSLAEAQRLALQQNPAFLAERQEAAIARAQLRQARTYAFNPEITADAPGLASDG